MCAKLPIKWQLNIFKSAKAGMFRTLSFSDSLPDCLLSCTEYIEHNPTISLDSALWLRGITNERLKWLVGSLAAHSGFFLLPAFSLVLLSVAVAINVSKVNAARGRNWDLHFRGHLSRLPACQRQNEKSTAQIAWPAVAESTGVGEGGRLSHGGHFAINFTKCRRLCFLFGTFVKYVCHTRHPLVTLSCLPFLHISPPLHFVYCFNYATDKATTATPTAICIKCVPPASSIVLVVRNQIKQKVETDLPSPPSAPALPFNKRLHHQEFPLGSPFPSVTLLLLYIFVIYLIIMQMLRRPINLPPNAQQYFRFAYF